MYQGEKKCLLCFVVVKCWIAQVNTDFRLTRMRCIITLITTQHTFRIIAAHRRKKFRAPMKRVLGMRSSLALVFERFGQPEDVVK